ncbi:MAG: hypothetical protein EOO29_08775 [Comamonadaceae bacterium]|nr:MAG: hypothetical protein EOO29_08775 [Comamonadaceae bacterium]
MTAVPSSASQTVAERQTKYRKSLQRKSLEHITLVVTAATAKLLRDLSRTHDESMARVLELSALLAQRDWSHAQRADEAYA